LEGPTLRVRRPGLCLLLAFALLSLCLCLCLCLCLGLGLGLGLGPCLACRQARPAFLPLQLPPRPLPAPQLIGLREPRPLRGLREPGLNPGLLRQPSRDDLEPYTLNPKL